jgi:hypothetical protein
VKVGPASRGEGGKERFGGGGDVERNKEIQEERRLASYALIQISSQPSDRPRALIRATSSATSKSSWKMKGGGNSKGDKEGRHNQLLMFVCQGRPEG